MVSLYLWSLVALLVAGAVLALAAWLAPRDPAEGRTGRSLVSDFRAGVRPLLDGVRSLVATVRRRGAAPDGTAPGTSAPRRVPALPTSRGPVGGTWALDEDTQTTTIDDFFEATRTDGPAYLDSAELADALHRRR
ncbi:hypothetical protein [Sanguibacter suaedae]|uniref:Uncharacterized protein n=1 Tax=Sanguibacter suaedae TaxID=2795737 RepID=A0A934MAX3_9MICO|nr:hypothetical protein [Sanguibacter suaedae]MBI9116248.1 hypothetical protein [Sanguibacter suaedae]